MSAVGDNFLRQLVARTVKLITTTVTRPADTNAYTAGDVLCNSTSSPQPITFTGAANRNGGGGIIHSLYVTDSVDAGGTKPDLELWLYSLTPTMQNDNAAWAPDDVEIEQRCIGMVKIPVADWITGNGNINMTKVNLGLAFQCDAASKNLFGHLVVRNAYAPPSNSERFGFRLGVEQH